MLYICRSGDIEEYKRKYEEELEKWNHVYDSQVCRGSPLTIRRFAGWSAPCRRFGV